MTDDKIELTRRKILGSVGAVGAAGAAAGLGTSALLGDNESFANNSITAGTLDLIVDAEVVQANDEYENAVGTVNYMETADGAVGAGLQLDDVKPGDWVIVCYDFSVQSNPGCVTITTENLTEFENGLTEPEEDVDSTAPADAGSLGSPLDGGGEGDLGSNLVAEIYRDFVPNPSNPQGPRDYLQNRDGTTPMGTTLSDADATYSTGVTIGGGTAFNTSDFYLLLYLPTDVGNVVQSDAVQWDLTFDAVQARNNDECSLADQCTPECPSPTNPDPGTDDFPVTIETIDKSAFPTVEVTTRVDTTAGGNGNIPDGNFSIDESTPNGIGSGFCGQTIESVTFGGQQQETLADVMFVIDNSGSMSGSKIENAREGAIELVGGDADTANDATQGGLDPTVNVGLVSYTASANTRAALGTDQNTVENEMSQLSGFNGTDLGAGISAANDEFFTDPSTGDFTLGPNNRSGVPDFMIVLGNGDTSGGKAPADIAKNNGVTIFGIAYGSGASVSDFSEISGEVPSDPDYQDFTFDADTDDITNIFQQIGQEIFGTYTIEYETANCEEDGLDRNVKVYVDDPNAGDADATGSYVAPN